MNSEELNDKQYSDMMWNGYHYLIRKEPIEHCYLRNKTEQIFYPFEFDNIKVDQIRMIIKFLEILQEYEKCSELKNYIKKVYGE